MKEEYCEITFREVILLLEILISTVLRLFPCDDVDCVPVSFGCMSDDHCSFFAWP